MPPLSTPLADSKFNLNSAGVAGFFGGKEAISAMATVHLYEGRRWLGWFNAPGSYTIAKRFGRMANSRFWDGLFPGSNDSPAVTFGLDGRKGPKYIGALSGTTMETGHLAYLTMERSRTEGDSEEVKEDEEMIGTRVTQPFDVAYLAMKSAEIGDDPVIPVQPRPIWDALLGLLPIVVSVVTCVMCALVYDWFSFSMILLGIISSGLASFVIGKGTLMIKSVKPAKNVPSGHGLLKGEDAMVVIRGREADVNIITKGYFYLETERRPKADTENGNDKVGGREVVCNGPNGHTANGLVRKGDERKNRPKKKNAVPCYHAIGVSSLLLLLQFLLQLLLVPQGSFFGQIMFLVSLGASWAYNSYLSSLEKEKIQIDLLFRALEKPEMRRFHTGTRTTMAVFVCLLVFHNSEINRSSANGNENRENRLKILNECIPNDTPVWRHWKNKVVQQLLSIDAQSESLDCLRADEQGGNLPESDKSLLQTLLKDAEAAFKKYFHVRTELPHDSTHLTIPFTADSDQATLNSHQVSAL